MLLRPASPGTGVIAGGGVRAVLELGGIRDVLAKSLGTTNPINMLKAAEQALRQLRRPEEVAQGARQADPRSASLQAACRSPLTEEVATSGEAKLTQIGARSASRERHRGTLRALGLGRIGKTMSTTTARCSQACFGRCVIS